MSIFVGAKEGFFYTGWEKHQKENNISHVQSIEDSNFSVHKKSFPGTGPHSLTNCLWWLSCLHLKLGGCHLAHRAENIYYLALCRKTLSTPAPNRPWLSYQLQILNPHLPTSASLIVIQQTLENSAPCVNRRNTGFTKGNPTLEWARELFPTYHKILQTSPSN